MSAPREQECNSSRKAPTFHVDNMVIRVDIGHSECMHVMNTGYRRPSAQHDRSGECQSTKFSSARIEYYKQFVDDGAALISRLQAFIKIILG